MGKRLGGGESQERASFALQDGLKFGEWVARDDEIAEPTLSTEDRARLFESDVFVRDGLPRLHELLSQGASRLELSLAAGPALAASLSLNTLEVVELGEEEESVLFSLASPAGVPVPLKQDARQGNIELRAGLAAPSSICAPLLSVVASLVHLAGRRMTPLPVAKQHLAMPSPVSTVPSVVALYRDAERVAASEVSVLILGESGTGKELLARYLHDASPRARGPFVALNCAALSRDLLELQLFGVDRGVATGVEARPGIFEAADQGTLFLDEVGDMAPETQARILRVLEERQVARLGSTTLRPARARIISATHRDLAKAVDQGRFRLDVYHRLLGWQAELPPLRARKIDLPQLALHFLERALRQRGVEARGLSRAAMQLLVDFSWPGNVRQLKAEMERAALFVVPGQLVDSTCLSSLLTRSPLHGQRTLKERIETFERGEIERTLDGQAGDVDRTAHELGVSRSTLYRRIKELGLSASPDA